MKTQHELPEEVVAAWAVLLTEQRAALSRARDVLESWSSIETAYEAGKATWSPAMKLRVRRMAMRARDALSEVKGTFFDTERWLEGWTKAGQTRLQAFAFLGADIPTFEPSAGTDQPVMPANGKADAILDTAIDHLGELVFDGDLYETYVRSVES